MNLLSGFRRVCREDFSRIDPVHMKIDIFDAFNPDAQGNFVVDCHTND